jgi:hypothetical protein
MCAHNATLQHHVVLNAWFYASAQVNAAMATLFTAELMEKAAKVG